MPDDGGTPNEASTPGDGPTTADAPAITECNDGIDNDGDGLTDWQEDPGCHGQRDSSEKAQPRAQENGWTTFDPDANSKVIFVSAQGGDDQNDGLSAKTPVQTLTKAASLVRDGQYDFMLLKRGDTWKGETLGRFKSGRDATHPLVIASYGDSTKRPRIEVDKNFLDHNGQARNYTAVLGLQIVASKMVVGDPAWDGATGSTIRYVGGGDNLLLEDLHLVHAEIVVQSYGTLKYHNVEIRRSIIDTTYHIDTCGQNNAHRPSGIYASHVDGLLIEQNLLDHNGWNEDVASACATMYNHNMYLNADNLVIRENFISRASSMGIKMRSDASGDAKTLSFENNFFYDGEIGLGIGGNTSEAYRFVDVTIKGNVFSQIGIGNPTKRNFSWMLDVSDHDTTVVEDNYFLHQPWNTNAYGISIGSASAKAITVRKNLFYGLKKAPLKLSAKTGWTGISVQDNRIIDVEFDNCLVEHSGAFAQVSYQNNAYSSKSTKGWYCVDGQRKDAAGWTAASGETPKTAAEKFVDPDRTLETYAKALGYADAVALILAAKQKNRLDYDPKLGGKAVNAYIKAGFAPAP